VAAISSLLSLALVTASIGMIMMKNWARKTFNIWAFIYVPNTILSSIFNYIYLAEANAAMVEEALGFSTGPQNPAAMVFGVACAAILFCVYPVLGFILLNTKRVKDAFEYAGSGGYYAPPGQY